jgi:1-phosphofructokinase
VSQQRAVVFAPSPLLTVTIEARPDGGPEIHLHAGGQGVWIARMLATLGLDVLLCTALGGEAGGVLRELLRETGADAHVVEIAADSGAYVHDRRAGERAEVADVPPPPLGRHELDALCNATLVEGLHADVVVLGGPDGPRVLPPDTYRRLAADLTERHICVVADLSGAYLGEVAAAGATVVKASDEDLVDDGRAASTAPDDVLAAMRELAAAGAHTVIVSRADRPALALSDGRLVEVVAPTFERVDHRGAGDSMTAGVAAALARGEGLPAALRLGAAAGALNATRHGLATGERELIEELAKRVEVRAAPREDG